MESSRLAREPEVMSVIFWRIRNEMSLPVVLVGDLNRSGDDWDKLTNYLRKQSNLELNKHPAEQTTHSESSFDLLFSIYIYAPNLWKICIIIFT